MDKNLFLTTYYYDWKHKKRPTVRRRAILATYGTAIYSPCDLQSMRREEPRRMVGKNCNQMTWRRTEPRQMGPLPVWHHQREEKNAFCSIWQSQFPCYLFPCTKATVLWQYFYEQKHKIFSNFEELKSFSLFLANVSAILMAWNCSELLEKCYCIAQCQMSVDKYLTWAKRF